MTPRLQLQRGFSLIELAIVLVIIGLLIGGGIVALQTATERQQRSEQRQQMREIRDALYGFAMSRRHLPCPDRDDDLDGLEDRDGDGTCAVLEGALPWATLGLGSRDAWGSRLRYRVHGAYAEEPDNGMAFGLEPEPGIELAVYERFQEDDLIAENIPALVVSYGPDGGRIWTDSGFTCPGLGEGLSREAVENCDSDSAIFYNPGYQRDDGEGGFQQMLMWLSEPVFKARMIEAGHLP